VIDLGIEMVEFDVRKTKDNVLICYHDANIQNIPISEMYFEQLKERVPEVCSFAEVIDICKEKIAVNVEIKESGFESIIVELLTKNFEYDSFFVTSFFPFIIRKIKKLDARIHAGLLLGHGFNLSVYYRVIKESIFMNDFLYSNADFISPFYKIYELGLMAKFKELEIPIQLWTVNDIGLLKDLINSDIQSIVTDIPEKALQIRSNSNNV
jgi:glycerophosphoryl diester phosphodiesterase